MPTPTPISVSMLSAFLAHDGFRPERWTFLDEMYRFPTDAYMDGPFAGWFTALLVDQGYQAIARAFDCEDHAIEAMARLHRANAIAQGAEGMDLEDGYGVTAGIVILPTRDHCVAAAVHVRGGGLVFQAREAQAVGNAFGLNRRALRHYDLTPEDKWEAKGMI